MFMKYDVHFVVWSLKEIESEMGFQRWRIGYSNEGIPDNFFIQTKV